ncbi:YwqI/YxiC family protein [Sporosarcina sp. FSL K6-1522]|uniref:YwqI/YxiC family protein n=1 Tax=Sporosarcina sp. FSL K6-1522 TaxID=2921554 RepID=UPI00315B17FC
MATEVKIVYADVEAQLADMNKAAESLKPEAEKAITGNTLDVVTKLTELSTQLEQLLERYQKVLLANCQTTTNSIEFMRESDEKISSVMQCTVSGPMKVTP